VNRLTIFYHIENAKGAKNKITKDYVLKMLARGDTENAITNIIKINEITEKDNIQ